MRSGDPACSDCLGLDSEVAMIARQTWDKDYKRESGAFTESSDTRERCESILASAIDNEKLKAIHLRIG